MFSGEIDGIGQDTVPQLRTKSQFQTGLSCFVSRTRVEKLRSNIFKWFFDKSA